MNRTQVAGSFLRGKGNKQSVLVKRVMKDGRVMSGLDFQADMRMKSDNQEEEKQTLGSQERQFVGQQNTIARESNIVNYATNQGSESRLRSTIYKQGSPNAVSSVAGNSLTKSPRGKTEIINLGDKKKLSRAEIGDMVVGVTDIITGATEQI